MSLVWQFDRLAVQVAIVVGAVWIAMQFNRVRLRLVAAWAWVRRSETAKVIVDEVFGWGAVDCRRIGEAWRAYGEDRNCRE
jgi:hypothetical protein